ncbi:MAG TPA: DoxX family protein [Tepidiformaceae bacterium]|nr:DoxX family protein [Tepidiformaceae bacterium]
MTVHTTATTIRTQAQSSPNPLSRVYRAASNSNRTLWATQGVLALIFLFAGVSKLVMSAESLTQDTDFPVAFLRFIGVCETLGAVGLILPGVLRIRRELTPLAAAGLVIIMVGAVATTVVTMGVAPAAMPFIVGLVCAFVATNRGRKLARAR